MNLEMMERGGRIWLEISSAVMELGGRERTEGCFVAQEGEEEEAVASRWPAAAS
jgi:hypothetical protein